ncbi:MAG: ferrochelatase [Ignavibacteriales bacterium]|nr:ferrochelatase [Ignavibacteriales bacterium]
MGRKKISVVLFQLGGPDSLDAVQPFLYNLFCDPDIIDLPGAFLFRKALARIISSRRAPKVQNLYRRIGSKSPILKQTQLQAESLKSALNTLDIESDVHIAMRYWHPMTEEVVRKLQECSVDELVLLPLYPHYSRATTGSSINEWNRVTQRLHYNSMEPKLVEHFYDHPLYIEAMVEQVNIALGRFSKVDQAGVHLVFSAHGIPVSFVKDGDPYPDHIKRSYELIVEKGSWGLPHHLCFQSKVGPQKWLEPSLTRTIEELAAQKISHIVVIPISFVTDHIETLSEINIEAREEAKELGIEGFEMMPALIRNKKFIDCLADLVVRQLKT